MIEKFSLDPSTLKPLLEKPLGPHINGFISLMYDHGYAKSTIHNYIYLLVRLNQWLQQQSLEIGDLKEEVIIIFFKKQQERKRRLPGNLTNLMILISFLRKVGVVPESVVKTDDSEISRIILDFEQYLIKERGLISRDSYKRYPALAQKFLLERFGGDGIVNLTEIKPQDITDFILLKAETLSSKTVQLVGSILRLFFRFLYLRGDITNDLSMAIPRITEKKMARLPKFLLPQQVKQILETCDQTTLTGIRDYAILLLFARLGLRSGEVVSMRLEDIDWEAGEITIRGKGSRRDKLPLPWDVGKALANYLKKVRPHCSSRHLFIRMDAPLRGFKNHSAIYSLVEVAFNRAGIDAPQKGPHILRHSLATEMINKGVPLSEIADILRHASLDTTRIYAKVDMTSLHTLDLPWPGGEK